jgi:hypothetical protein
MNPKKKKKIYADCYFVQSFPNGSVEIKQKKAMLPEIQNSSQTHKKKIDIKKV